MRYGNCCTHEETEACVLMPPPPEAQHCASTTHCTSYWQYWGQLTADQANILGKLRNEMYTVYRGRLEGGQYTKRSGADKWHTKSLPRSRYTVWLLIRLLNDTLYA